MRKKLVSETGTAILFIISSLIAVVLALELEEITPTNPTGNPGAGAGYVIYFIIAVIVMSALIIFIARKKKLGILKYIFAISIAFVILVVGSLLYALLPIKSSEKVVLTLATPVIILYFLLFRQNWIVVNIVGILTSAGLAAIWGEDLGVYSAVVLMLVFAIYDYIAVYKTKHMLDIARASTSSEMPLFFVVPDSRGFETSDIDIDTPGEERGAILIGFGDIAIPNVMVISSFLYGGSVFYPFYLLPLAGGIVAMFTLFMFIKRPAPGLPFLNTGVLIGFGIALLLAHF
ncbi:MAG: presenilin family intramembrane aspartyl protease [Candidatus Thermoplasmatota archaeon]|nr:presenilin family intramembrane aspartyl protease [Candidatus Thermoplasmatota archaeon]MCL5791052.1 presenilin family intramembrane aspartyl protease [Candidatus Thermoplasmatota archaeon]